jgi:hypothetical protein
MSLTIGDAITSSTAGYGLYVGTGGNAGLLEQFAYGAGNFAALQIAQGSAGAPILGFYNTTGNNDIAIGGGLHSDTGGNNIAFGANALLSNTSGQVNTAIGINSLQANTTGNYNIAVGYAALEKNINGGSQVAIGYAALYLNTTGASNSAIGYSSLGVNTTGYSNTALGSQSLFSNTTGFYNTALGVGASHNNTIGNQNVSIGYDSLQANVAGSQNTAVGVEALFNVGEPQTAGAFNIGTSYTIATVGTTDFTLIGASSNTVGVIFTATGVGSGTGTAFPNSVNNNTGLGFYTGRGIIYGINNTILGANVSGLAPGLSDAIILATGEGTIRADFNNTNAGAWTLSDGLVTAIYTIATLPAGVPAKRAFVSDLSGSSYVFGAAAVGGGTRGGPVFYSGSAWLEG